jgi:hypothetical protein
MDGFNLEKGMSTSYWAEIIVGLPCAEVDEALVDEVRDEHYIVEGISDKSPYYDGGGCGLFGITIRATPDYKYSLLNIDCLHSRVEEAKQLFFNHIGLEPRVYLTTRGS